MTFFPIRPTIAGLTLVASLGLAACGGDDPRTPAETKVGILLDTAMVDYRPDDSTSEGNGLRAGLLAAGFQLVEFATTDSDSVANVLSQVDVLVIPELEVGAWTSIPAGTRTAISAWVNAGGRLAIFGDANSDAVVINDATGASVVTGCCLQNEFPDSTWQHRVGVSGSFAAGADSIWSNDATSWIEKGTLPSGSKVAYGIGDSVTVAVIPSGSGRIAYFGWDYYDGAPLGSQDFGWLRFLPLLAQF